MSTACSTPIWFSIHPYRLVLESLPSARLHADVCIIGAGTAGLSTALALLEEGRSVIVLDREGIGAGETLRTTAHLASGIDERYY